MGREIFEIDIENVIWNSLSSAIERGFPLEGGVVYRQLPIPGCGIMDLCEVSVAGYMPEDGTRKMYNIEISIYELKKGLVKCHDIGQLARYKAGVIDTFPKVKKALGLKDDYILNVECFIVGKEIEQDAACLADACSFFAYGYEVTLEHGIKFHMINRGQYKYSDDFLERFKARPFITHARYWVGRKIEHDLLAMF